MPDEPTTEQTEATPEAEQTFTITATEMAELQSLRAESHNFRAYAKHAGIDTSTIGQNILWRVDPATGQPVEAVYSAPNPATAESGAPADAAASVPATGTQTSGAGPGTATAPAAPGPAPVFAGVPPVNFNASTAQTESPAATSNGLAGQVTRSASGAVHTQLGPVPGT